MAWHLYNGKKGKVARRILRPEESRQLKSESIKCDFDDYGVERYWLEDGSYVLESGIHIDPNINNQLHLEWYLNKNPEYQENGC